MEKKESLCAVAKRINQDYEAEIYRLYGNLKERSSTYNALSIAIDLLTDNISFENEELAKAIKVELLKKMAEEMKQIEIKK